MNPPQPTDTAPRELTEYDPSVLWAWAKLRELATTAILSGNVPKMPEAKTPETREDSKPAKKTTKKRLN